MTYTYPHPKRNLNIVACGQVIVKLIQTKPAARWQQKLKIRPKMIVAAKLCRRVDSQPPMSVCDIEIRVLTGVERIPETLGGEI